MFWKISIFFFFFKILTSCLLELMLDCWNSKMITCHIYSIFMWKYQYFSWIYLWFLLSCTWHVYSNCISKSLLEIYDIFLMCYFLKPLQHILIELITIYKLSKSAMTQQLLQYNPLHFDIWYIVMDQIWIYLSTMFNISYQHHLK